jgi:hypothetical protein
MLFLAVTGALVAILLRLINTAESRGENFSHPFFIPSTMVIGDALWIFIYFYEIRRARKRFGSYQLHPKVVNARTRGRGTDVNPLYFLPPRLINIIASSLLAMSYSYVGTSENSDGFREYNEDSHSVETNALSNFSILQSENNSKPFITFELALVLQGNIILIIILVSRLFLKREQYRHNWVGVVFILVATWMIWVPFYVDEHESVGNVLIGTVLVLGSTLLFSLQYIIEERLISNNFLSPARLVGWEGIWGLMLLVIFLPIFYIIKWNAHFCSNGMLDDSLFALRQMWSNLVIMFLMIGCVVVSAAANMFGVTITKYTSANNRASLSILRFLPFWIFFIAFQGDGNQTINYVQLTGYILLVIGVILYNEILVIPAFGLDENTMEKIDERNNRAESIWDDDSTNLMSTLSYQVNI